MGFFGKPQVIGPGSGSDGDRARIAELETRVARLEAQLAHLAQSGAEAAPATAPPTAPTEAWLAEVQDLKRSGKVIHAIKLYREHTGVGLKEAKDAVDAMPS